MKLYPSLLFASIVLFSPWTVKLALSMNTESKVEFTSQIIPPLQISIYSERGNTAELYSGNENTTDTSSSSYSTAIPTLQLQTTTIDDTTLRKFGSASEWARFKKFSIITEAELSQFKNKFISFLFNHRNKNPIQLVQDIEKMDLEEQNRTRAQHMDLLDAYCAFLYSYYSGFALAYNRAEQESPYTIDSFYLSDLKPSFDFFQKITEVIFNTLHLTMGLSLPGQDTAFVKIPTSGKLSIGLLRDSTGLVPFIVAGGPDFLPVTILWGEQSLGVAKRVFLFKNGKIVNTPGVIVIEQNISFARLDPSFDIQFYTGAQSDYPYWSIFGCGILWPTSKMIPYLKNLAKMPMKSKKPVEIAFIPLWDEDEFYDERGTDPDPTDERLDRILFLESILEREESPTDLHTGLGRELETIRAELIEEISSSNEKLREYRERIVKEQSRISALVASGKIYEETEDKETMKARQQRKKRNKNKQKQNEQSSSNRNLETIEQAQTDLDQNGKEILDTLLNQRRRFKHRHVKGLMNEIRKNHKNAHLLTSCKGGSHDTLHRDGFDGIAGLAKRHGHQDNTYAYSEVRGIMESLYQILTDPQEAEEGLEGKSAVKAVTNSKNKSKNNPKK